jgi:hypothetical protein
MSVWKALNGRVTLLPPVPLASGPPSALDVCKSVWHLDPEGFNKKENPLRRSIAHGKRSGWSSNYQMLWIAKA